MSRFEDNGNLQRMKALTGAYYGVEEDENDAQEARENAGNMDSSYFDVNQTTSEILRNTPYLKLLDMDEELRKTIIHLDSEMQLLVYNNYSRFIGATDTMQNMKEKLIKMESQVSGLESRMEAIANGTRRMNERNATRREEVARLDRLGGLVSKLSTLFELPKKLRQVSDFQETRDLVEMFKSAMPYLAKHLHIPSFAKIERDAKDATIEIQGRLKIKLLSDEIYECTPDEVEAICSVLIGLGETREEIAPTYFRYYRDYVTRTGVAKEEAVKETFETCTFLLRTTMFEPLNRALTDAERFFPESQVSDDIAERKMALAKDVIRSILDKMRARFDAESMTFLNREEESEDESEGGPVDRIIRALALCIKECTSWDKSLPTQTLTKSIALTDRAQELAERVVRKQVQGIMGELKTRTEEHLALLNEIDDFKRVVDKCADSIVGDASEAKSNFVRLLKKATLVMAPAGEMTSAFDDLFKFQMRDWSEFLAAQLKMTSPTTSTNTLLAKALVARVLSDRAKDLGVHDQKQLLKSLTQASDDALRNYCSGEGILASEKLMISAENPRMDSKPRSVGDGVVYMLNHIVGLGRTLKAAGVPSRRTTVASNPAVTGGQAGSTGTYTRGGTAATKPGAGTQGGSNLLGTQILKMFAEKLVVLDKVDLDTASIAAAALRVALKTWFEYIREEIINRYEFQQIQLDANFVRTFVPLIAGDAATNVNKLIAEVVASARERCVDPSTMDPVALDMLCNERKDDVKFRG